MSERNYYMVRAQRSTEEDFSVFFKNSVIAVGWSRVNFSKYEDDDLLEKAVRESYYQEKYSSSISKKLNEVKRFKLIKDGDYILVPYYNYVVIAEATSEEKYSDDDMSQDLSNQKIVRYRFVDNERLLIPRNELSEGLQRRIRVRGSTVSNLCEFSEEIEELFKHKEGINYSNKMIELENAQTEQFKKDLLIRIQNGNTYLQTGGYGFEELIRELMICEGYEARISPRNSGLKNWDVDIIAEINHFIPQKLLIQVKHHCGVTNECGIQQIIGALKEDKYEEFQGVVITSGNTYTEEAKRIAEENDIKLIDGKEVVDLIFDNLSSLKWDTKKKLGISAVPQFLHIWHISKIS